MRTFLSISILTIMGSTLLPACEQGSSPVENADITSEIPTINDAEFDSVADNPLDWSVFEPGPYRIGFDDFFVSYTPAGAESERELRVAYWYPTLDESGDEGRYAQLFSREEVFARASIAEDGPYPVLIFSHGYQGIAEQSYFMMEFLATHGWIVLAPEHTGNTTMDTSVPDYLLDEFRPQDLSAVIDTVEDLSQEHRLFNQLSDVLAVSGHSYGGYTTLAFAGSGYDMNTLTSACNAPESEACLYTDDTVIERYEDGFSDYRVDLAIPMAPAGAAEFGQEGLSAIEVPVLLMTGSLDQSTTDAAQGDPIWSGLNGEDDIRISFLTGAHFTFSNGCDLFPSMGAGDGCLGDFIDAHEANDIINVYVLSFLRYHLFDDMSVSEILDGTQELHPDVLLLNKE